MSSIEKRLEKERSAGRLETCIVCRDSKFVLISSVSRVNRRKFYEPVREPAWGSIPAHQHILQTANVFSCFRIGVMSSNFLVPRNEDSGAPVKCQEHYFSRGHCHPKDKQIGKGRVN